MAYLCPRHQIIISDNIQLAHELWTGAMESGYEALNQHKLSDARNFFGSAYEIAILRIRIKIKPPASNIGAFGIEHLLDSGNLLLRVLMELGLFDEAELCLMTIHNGLIQNGLLQSSANEPKPCELRRISLLRSAREGLDRLADELAIKEKLTFYKRSMERGAIKGSRINVSLH